MKHKMYDVLYVHFDFFSLFSFSFGIRFLLVENHHMHGKFVFEIKYTKKEIKKYSQLKWLENFG